MPDRAAVLAELGKIRAANSDGETAPKVAKAAPIKAAPSADAAADPEPEIEASAVDPDEDNDTTADPETADADQPDAETQKRLEMVTRAEKRSRQALAKERADFDLDRRTFLEDQRKHKAEVEQLTALKARAKIDPWRALQALGLTEDDAEHAAKAIYANSKAAAANPANRAAVEAAITKREADARVAELEAKLAKLEETDAQRQQHQQLATAAERYMGEVEKSVTDATPLIKRQMTKNPQKFAAGIAATYAELLAAADDDDEIPAAADVVKTYEKKRRAELEADDVDVDAYLAKKPAATATTAVAGKTKTIGNGVGGATRPKPASAKPLDGNGSLTEEARNETLAELAAIRAQRRDDD